MMRQKFSLRRTGRLALPMFFLIVAAGPVYAEGFIAPLIGVSFGNQSVACGSSACAGRTSWGISAGTAHGIFGFEEDLSYVPQFFGKTSGSGGAVLTISSNFIVRHDDGPIRPYAVFGFAFIRPHASLDAEGLGTTRTVLGYDVGGGVNLFTKGRVGVRSDLRRIATVKDATLGVFGTEQVKYWRGSVGATFTF